MPLLVGHVGATMLVGRLACKNLYSFRRLSSTIGYECSVYIDNERDVATVDKLLASAPQMKSIYVSGDRIGYHRVYETVTDASMTNETLNLSEYNIKHKLSKNHTNWKEELDVIHNIIDIKHLGSVILPINIEITENILDLIATRTEGTKLLLGIELSTEYIISNSHEDAIKHINRIMKQNRFGAISIAFNSFTSKKALSIYNHIKKTFPNIIINIVELLRAHPRKPGLLFIESGYKLGSKELKIDEKDTKLSVQSDMTQSVEDFKRSLDRCIHLEKQILAKLSNKGLTDKVNVNSFCWGNILGTAQSSILFPEEWGYVVDNTIMNELNNEKMKMDNIGTEYREWMSLYMPMAKYLFSSFLVLQNHRKYLLLVEICEAINSHHNRVIVTASGLPTYLRHIIAALIASDQDLVQVDLYTSFIDASPRDTPFPRYTQDEALVVIDIVKNLLESFGKTE